MVPSTASPDSGLPVDAWLLCATPRTGSTLLCQYLDSSAVAGHPDSWFRAEDMPARAKNWGIARADGAFNFAGYLAEVHRRSSTSNGVAGLRLMWETLPELTAALAAHDSGPLNNDLGLLQQAFGRLAFVYLHRTDLLAQAISLVRAEQTGYWHSTEQGPPAGAPRYDRAAIARRLMLLRGQDEGWNQWFRLQGVEPLRISYEQLAAEPAAVVEAVLGLLGFRLADVPALHAGNRRLADATSAHWARWFLAE